MLALAPPSLHSEHPSTSWHGPAPSRYSSRSHPASHTQPYYYHHDEPTHQTQRSSRSTSTPVNEASTSAGVRHSRSVSESRQPLAAVPAAPVPEPVDQVLENPSVPVDLHSIPQKELIKHLANLLSQIAAANDALPQPDPPHYQTLVDESDRPPIWRSLTTASRGAFNNPTSALAFHARNIPTFPLEAYLLRILKYCPIPNEVFLSLLVYFDRMTRLARDTTGAVFAIDSYNVHRLVIAGVTVASKFLSDIFYTNTRYAKVGGLPRVEELNQLELQFLLLNNFNLVISQAEMQKYTEDLMAFARASVLPTTLANPASYEPQPTPPAQSVWNTPHTASYATDPEQSDAEPASDAGDYTTDDEPTIRAAHSSASSETQSIFTVTSEDTDADHADLPDDDDDDDEPQRGLYTQ